MGWLSFASSLVQALAWPTLVLAAFLTFRQPIGNLLDHLTHLGAGSFSADFEAQAREVEHDLTAASGRVGVEMLRAPKRVVRPASDGISTLRGLPPTSAILKAFSLVEARLGALVGSTGDWRSLAVTALKRGTITEQNFTAIQGLAALRNLVAHSDSAKVDQEKANEYLAYVDALLVALPSTPSVQP